MTTGGLTMKKQLLALLLAVLLTLTAIPFGMAEETVSAADAENVADLDAVNEEEEEVWEPIGDIYEEPDISEFNRRTPALYTGKMLANRSIFTERSINSARVTRSGNGITVDILFVGQDWCVVRTDANLIGFARRQYLYDVFPVDKTTTPPYGVQKSTYVATTAKTCPVYKSMSEEEESFVVLNPGTMLSIWKIQDGWGIVPYWRTFGYINMNNLTDLIPVSPTDTPIREDSPIAAYTSYYNMAQTEMNLSRITNIRVACKRLTRVMKPGASLNFNNDVGPFRKTNGYEPAPVLINGVTKPGYGGGTCQVSSTLYNALLQLPGVNVSMRRPHGPSGAAYLPHGVDAAVGSDNLNLIFTNHYKFPIRVEGHTSDDGALLMLVYRAD